ncbi:MAG TPA: hypothetical protein PK280_05455 [Planctomycetota bacterium]|nr:hypothetical protein [Planctomycetota bacterium]
MRRVSFLCLLSTALLAFGGNFSPAGEAPAAPAKGEPFPGDGGPIDYEDVLDRADLVLAGTVAKLTDGQVELEDVRALRGEFAEKTARVGFAGSWADTPYQPPVAGRAGAFLCLRDKGGALRLAGNPPRGAGFMPEGSALASKLLEAAKDPRKGYESKDAAVRLSSACRLAKAWTAAPEDKKPELPAGIVEVLLAGMEPGDLQGRQVNSAARYALNSLLACDLNKLVRYSTNGSDESCRACAARAREIWQRTVARIEERRSGAKPPPPPAPDEKEAQAAKLVTQLGDNSFEKREAAQAELVRLGKPAVKAVEEGTRSKDPEISTRCTAILEALKAAGAAVPPKEMLFDLDRAERFLPAARQERRPLPTSCPSSESPLTSTPSSPAGTAARACWATCRRCFWSARPGDATGCLSRSAWRGRACGPWTFSSWPRRAAPRPWAGWRRSPTSTSTPAPRATPCGSPGRWPPTAACPWPSSARWPRPRRG